jgi:DNA-binding protein YbaB
MNDETTHDIRHTTFENYMTLFSKLKQIKDLKSQASQLKNLLAGEKIEIDDDGVKIAMDGNQEILNVTIDENLLSPEKKEKLEKIIQTNSNAAIKKIQKVMAEKIQSSGFQMPNL